MKISGILTTISENDDYPILDPNTQLGGFRTIDDINLLNSIPESKRKAGMVVGVPNTNTTDYYTLKRGITWSYNLTDWDNFLTPIGATVVPIRNYINDTVNIPENYQLFLYGNLTIATGGNLQNSGQTVLINGSINLSGTGTYSNLGSGSIDYVSLTSKKVGTFSITSGTPVIINHNLNTEDVVFSFRENNNYIQFNVEVQDSNNIKVTSNGNYSIIKYNIIG